MNRRIAFPFLVLPASAVTHSCWLAGTSGHELNPVGDILDNWDYARNLPVATTVRFDWNAIASALQLPVEELCLRLSLLVGTGKGALPRKQYRLVNELVIYPRDTVDIDVTVPGRRLSGRLLLTLQIALEGPLVGGTLVSPATRGARLWKSSHDILIEDGGQARFPIETTSFLEMFGNKPFARAPWYLKWKPSALDADFAGTVRLYVNEDCQSVCERFVAGDEAVLQVIMADVASQMIEAVLRDQQNDSLDECEEGSIGKQIGKWLDLTFPGKELSLVRAALEHDPGSFRATILDAMNLESPQ